MLSAAPGCPLQSEVQTQSEGKEQFSRCSRRKEENMQQTDIKRKCLKNHLGGEEKSIVGRVMLSTKCFFCSSRQQDKCSREGKKYCPQPYSKSSLAHESCERHSGKQKCQNTSQQTHGNLKIGCTIRGNMPNCAFCYLIFLPFYHIIKALLYNPSQLSLPSHDLHKHPQWYKCMKWYLPGFSFYLFYKLSTKRSCLWVFIQFICLITISPGIVAEQDCVREECGDIWPWAKESHDGSTCYCLPTLKEEVKSLTLKEVKSMRRPHTILPPALKMAARDTITARKWSSLIKVWPKLLPMALM